MTVAMLRSTSYGSRLLYHRFIPGTQSQTSSRTSSESLPSSTQSAPTPFPMTMPTQPSCRWDQKAACQPLFPALYFISQKLAESGLQITLLISEQAPFVIPVWPMSRKSQLTLTRIIRKACSKFKVGPSWMNTLARLNRKTLASVFDAYQPDSYVVRRSLLQQEIAFTADGFTLLSVDHIFTLKQLLCILNQKDRMSFSRDVCLTSCASLLRRICTIHNGTPFSKAYMQRVYLELPLYEPVFDEVVDEYNRTYCTANLRDVASDLDCLDFYHMDSKNAGEMLSPIVELPDTGLVHELVTPISEANLASFTPPWTRVPASGLERVSNISVSIPQMQRPATSPMSAQEAQIGHRSELTTPITHMDVSSPYAPPTPLKIVKRISDVTALQDHPDLVSAEPSDKLSDVVEETGSEPSSQYSRPTMENDVSRLSFKGLQELEEELKAEQMETTKLIVEAWSRGVEKNVCARCCDVICADGIQPARRVTVCY